MSMPKLPEENTMNREEAVNLILTSIAMEELGLSHILNAEGEKLQYVLGTAKGTAGLEDPPTVEDILEVNKSVHQTLNNATRLQMMLGAKMESAISTPTMQGPTGPTGPFLDTQHLPMRCDKDLPRYASFSIHIGCCGYVGCTFHA